MSNLSGWKLADVSGEAMREWCELLRDDNAIHLDPQAAAALGFGPRTVNPGPANLGYILNFLAASLPNDSPQSLDARFMGNVLAGDTVEVDGVMNGNQVSARLTVKNDAGEHMPVVEAQITLVSGDSDAAHRDV
jgi:acyl dehydratase